MNSIRVICCGAALLLLASCGNNQPVDNHDNKGDMNKLHATEIYACPMHPEVIGAKGDKCNKCGMDLMPVDSKSASKEFVMEMRVEPSKLSAQGQGKLIFTPKVKGSTTDRVPLEIVHDKKIHLIIVNNDLSYFDHVHPEYQSSGDYLINVADAKAVSAAGIGNSTTQFPNGGDYTVFADYLPTGASHQLEKLNLQIDGSVAPKVSWTKENLTAFADDFSMTLKPGGGKFVTKQSMHIDAPLTYKGKALTTSELDNFLGAKAHMVVIGIDDMSYLHVHPEEFEGNLDLHANFEKPGMYRGWIQFSYKGKLQTMSFVIKVEEGTGESVTTHDQHEHNH